MPVVARKGPHVHFQMGCMESACSCCSGGGTHARGGRAAVRKHSVHAVASQPGFPRWSAPTSDTEAFLLHKTSSALLSSSQGGSISLSHCSVSSYHSLGAAGS